MRLISSPFLARVCPTKQEQFVWTWKGIPNNRYCPGSWASCKIFTFIFLGFWLNCKSVFKIKKIMNRRQAATGGFLLKNMFLEISQNSKENTCARVSFLISLFFNKIAGLTLLKKRLWHRGFPVNFAKFPRTPFLKNTSLGDCLCMNDFWNDFKKIPHDACFCQYVLYRNWL